jgi:hypothetical protein
MTDRDRWFAPDEEALQTDAYLESLLAAHARVPRSAAEPGPLEALAPELQRTADLLERVLPRLHPSFRFEETLAGRLRTMAELDQPDRPRLSVVAFPAPTARLAAPVGELGTVPARTGGFRPDELIADPRARGIILGGAIASGVSLAGAALLAWRRTRRTRPH